MKKKMNLSQRTRTSRRMVTILVLSRLRKQIAVVQAALGAENTAKRAGKHRTNIIK